MENQALLKVRVSTGSKRFSVEGFDEWTGELRVKLKSLPVKGKANEELLEALSQLLGAEVRLAGGEKSSKKQVRVKGKTIEQVEMLLKGF